MYPDNTKIFDNIHFNSEFYNALTNQDLHNITFNKVQIWNEYQDSGSILLDPTSYRNISKRRFRKWNFILPRNANSRDRINNPWAFIKLVFNKNELPTPYSTNDIKLVLHDLLVSFTTRK
jgi:hypothetical protein